MTSTTEQDRLITEVVAQQGSRLRSFIRGRVPRETDAEDILQEVFYELVKAHRLLMPIDTVSAWLFRVARNRITDLFRKKAAQNFSDLAGETEDGEGLEFEDLLIAPGTGPESNELRSRLFDAMQSAIAELPREQREVFIAHELEGRSFKEVAAETGVSINTLLSRKRYAILVLRKRLENIHEEFTRERGLL